MTDHGLIVAGIDPGITGALAVLNEDGDCDTTHIPMMDNIIDGGAVIRWLTERDVQLVVIEAAAAYRIPDKKTGKWRAPGSKSMFSFGQAYGQLLGALQAACIPYRVVTPARWKKDMQVGRDKEECRRRAIELLPKIAEQFSRKKDEGRAEAALIAWWYLHARQAVKVRSKRVYPKGLTND